MSRTLACLVLIACSPTPIDGGECDPSQCATRQCANGRCIDVIDGGTISVDTGFDSSTTDAGPMLPDGGPSACALPCRANESCFRGRCVLCDGDQQVEGCACSGPETCRTGTCIGGVCQMCTRSADCMSAEGTAVCDEGICSTCGGAGESCCPDPATGMETMCSEMAGMCTVAGRCGDCGAIGQSCCAVEGCTAGVCGSTGVCEADATCGMAGQPACPDGTCAPLHIPNDRGVCVPCGVMGMLCCPTAPRCTGGLRCNGLLCLRDER